MTSPTAPGFFSLLRAALKEFHKNDPLRMAAATAFFATFALPAILMILIQAFGLVVDPMTISRHLFEQLAGVLGKYSVNQVREVLRNVRHLAQTWYITAGGFLFLIFVATTLFKVIKDSVNQLWQIKIHDRPGIGFLLQHRARSIVVILLAGALFLAVILAEGIGAFLKEYANSLWPYAGLFLGGLLNQLVSVLVVTIWFTVLFRFLPDGRPAWKVALAGGFFTSLLFTVGKLLLRFLLSYSNMHTIYGASTSFVLMLLFIFYSSFIFYFGACFTKVWADSKKLPIRPTRHAVKYTISQIEVES